MVLNLIAAFSLILLIIILHQRMHYLLIFCLLVFAVPDLKIGQDIFRMLRWVVYYGFILLAFLHKKETFLRKLMFIDIVALLFILMLFSSYFNSIDPELTLKRGISVVVMYFAIFWGLYNYITNIEDVHKWLNSILIFLILYNLAGIAFQIPHPTGRFGGLSGHPSGTAAINTFILPIALMSYTLKRGKINLLIIIFIAGIVYVTYTRTAFIALILSPAFFYSQLFHKTRIVFVFLASLLIIAILLSFFIVGIWLPEKLVRIKTLPILGGRIEAWQAARGIIAKRPLSGFGFGTEDLLFEYFNIRLLQHSGVYFHNAFFGLAAQIGIPVAFVFFAIIFYFIVSTINYVSKITDRNLKLTGIALNTILFVGFVYCFAESWIYSAGNASAFLYFIIVVLTIRFKELTKEEISQSAA